MSEEDLRRTLDEAEWAWLKPHAERDAVIIVTLGLDLLDVARAIAQNDSRQIQTWLSQGLLAKPTSDQMSAWDQAPERRFLSIVVQPFVLIQELLVH